MLETFIAAIATKIVAPTAQLVRELRERLGLIYSAFINTLARIRNGFSRLVLGAALYVSATAMLGLATLNRIRWLLFVELPRRGIQLSTDVLAVAHAYIDQRINALRALVTVALALLESKVDSGLAGLRALVGLATAELAQLRSDLATIKRLVLLLLTDPKRFAAWVFEALLGYALESAMDVIERVTDWFWAHRRKAEQQALALAERILERML